MIIVISTVFLTSFDSSMDFRNAYALESSRIYRQKFDNLIEWERSLSVKSKAMSDLPFEVRQILVVALKQEYDALIKGWKDYNDDLAFYSKIRMRHKRD